MKKIQNITIGKQSISGRLAHLRHQIEECDEKGIPEKFWCEKCKEANKKVNHLLEVLKLKVLNNIINSKSQECLPDYENVYETPTFVCEKCHKLYYSRLHLVKDEHNLVCCDCGGTLIKIEINGNTQ